MGYLVYNGERLDLSVEDRTLAHLQIVIINKLRKGETFAFSWKDSAESGDGRSTVWLAPSISLHFKFAGSRMPDINPTWLQLLYETADSGKGLIITDEPARDATALPADTVVPIGVGERGPVGAKRSARPAGGR